MNNVLSNSIDFILRFFLLIILFWLPIPLGSVQPWAIASVEICIFACAALWFFRRMFSAQESLRFSIFLFSLIFLALVGIFQLIPLSYESLSRFSPGYAALLGELGLQKSSQFSLSVNPYVSFLQVLKILSLATLYFLVLNLFSSKRSLYILIGVVVFTALFQSVYGIIQYSGNDYSFLGIGNQINNFITGTYINKNHFAGLLTLLFPLCLGVFGYFISRLWANNDSDLTSEKIAKILLFGTLVLIVAVALVLSGSRAGVIATALSTLFFLFMLSFKYPYVRIPFIAMITLLMIGIFGGIYAYIQGFWPEWLPAFPEKSSFHGRLDIWKSSWEMFSQNKLFGFGLGTYQYVFPAFAKLLFAEGIRVNFAHNDFLQLLCEGGVVGFLIVGLGFFVLLIQFLKLFKKRSHSYFFIGLGALAGVVGMLIHGLFDFNFQIPANLFLWIVVLAITENMLLKPYASYEN